MGKKYDIQDEFGNKIGTVEKRSDNSVLGSLLLIGFFSEHPGCLAGGLAIGIIVAVLLGVGTVGYNLFSDIRATQLATQVEIRNVRVENKKADDPRHMILVITYDVFNMYQKPLTFKIKTEGTITVRNCSNQSAQEQKFTIPPGYGDFIMGSGRLEGFYLHPALQPAKDTNKHAMGIRSVDSDAIRHDPNCDYDISGLEFHVEDVKVSSY